MHRRHFLATATLPLLGCTSTREIAGGFTGIALDRGHRLRDTRSWPAPSTTRRTEVVIAGGGVAGLAAARALRLKGVEDFALLELEDSAGGNSRSGTVNGIACPLGAHYLPVPGDDAPEVQDLLEELGLRQRVAGRWQYAERHLCHSPQERLFFNGGWQDGLLPVQGVGPATLVQYQKFAALVEQLRQQAGWTIPASKLPFTQVHQALAAITFAAYLDQQGLDDVQLRWYLDYCCRDDYGAGLAMVSAWAGIHYFASRHGFHAPGAESGERKDVADGVLAWPEGNAWLAQRLAAPLGARLHSGQVVVRIAETRQGVEVDAFNTATQTLERWQARRAIVALPVFIAARVVQNPPDFLRAAAARTTYAPWLVANIHIDAPLQDRPGAAPSWDNVLYRSPGLGYVDAMHQSLLPVPGATVLSYYRALGDVPDGRRLLLDKPWAAWRDEILAELGTAHPDIATKATRIDITRYGHAMAIPTPAVSSQIGLQRILHQRQQLQKTQRLVFAHSDWAGYSVFEEAFTLGHQAA
nr:FAD-dependent oxidoreductase [uncultured Albidiferax sp.]